MTEDTLDNEALIAEQLRDAQVANLPSDLKDNPVISRGDATLPAPMTVKEISGAGHVWVWDSRTYEKIPILYYMLPSKLRQHRKDGSFRFTTTDPKQKPARGEFKCMLHKDGENRKHYDIIITSPQRRALKRGATSDFTLTQHRAKLEAYNYQCAYCGVYEVDTGKKLHMEHIHPLSKGGPHTNTNIVPSCKPCNNRKFISVGKYAPMPPEIICLYF